MPRPGSDVLTEEVRSAVEGRATSDLREAMTRIATAEAVPRAQLYRKAVKEFVARWDAQHRPTESSPAIPPGVFP